MADRIYGIPALGTMAHSWVQMFPSEYEAFRRYAELYPDNCTLLVDTCLLYTSQSPPSIHAGGFAIFIRSMALGSCGAS